MPYWIPILLSLLGPFRGPVGKGPEPLDCASWASQEFPGQRVFWIDPTAQGARNDGPGSQAQPWSSLHAARRNDLRTGDVLVLAAGLYRESIHPKAHGLAVVGCPGTEVVITGANELRTSWQRDGLGWTADRYRPRDGWGDRYDTNLIVANGHPLIPVDDPELLFPGSFSIAGGKKLLVRLPDDINPASANMEVGVREVLFEPPGDAACADKPDAAGATLGNLVFKHAANAAQTGAVCLSGHSGRMDQVSILETNGRGLEVWGADHRITRVTASRNGQLGVGGGCRACLLEDVTADRNNWRAHDPYWEAGGGKWVQTSRTIFRRFVARRNDGPGLWFDGFSSENLVEDAVLVGNLVSGLQVELGSDHNLMRGSRVFDTRRDGWAGEGVLIMASSGTRLEGNVIAHNAGNGLWLRKDSRQATGGVSAVGNLFLENAPESSGWEYQVRLEVDGGAGPGVVWKENYLVSSSPDRTAGIAPSVDDDVRRVRDADDLHDVLGVSGPTRIIVRPPGAGASCNVIVSEAELCRLLSSWSDT
jgi:parallel beta helix pectate lyase-like protein